MSMKTRDEKEKKRDLFTTIFWILVLVFLIVKIVIPETGVLGMVNEGSNAVLFFGIGGSCVWTIIHKRKTNGGCFRSIAAGIDIRYWRMDIRKACIGSYIRTGGCASDVSYYA